MPPSTPPSDFLYYRREIIARAKSGVEFMVAAGIVWALITGIWLTGYSAYDRSVMTFIVGAIMLPLAFGLSKVFRTTWKIPGNPLEPLGLWLNFAQLFYFPFLVYFLLRDPEAFIMGYAIITGAHLFPYAWFYDELGYAIGAGVIAVGALFLRLLISPDSLFVIPLFASVCFFALAGWLFARRARWKETSINPLPATAD
ncbi:DUF7010 family protein [Lewinella sp. IMCC34191]|uniref:DUF7010 family protein n=1 Tax=Lewinella sp. IMCC34191 TaxID=2259172 RepID=UPI0018E4DEE8|nr:hypothetical protein [Lewinella sp. IMCC34191]